MINASFAQIPFVSEAVAKEESSFAAEAAQESAETWVSLIVMLGIGLAGSYLVKMAIGGTKLPTDAYIAAAGAVVYIYAEYQAWSDYKDFSEETIKYYQRDLTGKQKSAFESQKNDYIKLRDTAKNKAKLQQIASLAFLAAAAVAYFKNEIIEKTSAASQAECEAKFNEIETKKKILSKQMEIKYNARVAALSSSGYGAVAAKQMAENEVKAI